MRRAYSVAQIFAAVGGALASSAYVGWKTPPSDGGGQLATLEGPLGLEVLECMAFFTCILLVLCNWMLLCGGAGIDTQGVSHSVGLVAYLLRCGVGMLAGAAFFHLFVVLFGAPLYVMFYKSFLWSAVQAAYVFVPCAGAYGLNLDAWTRIFLFCEWRSNFEKLCAWTAFACCLGAWLGACLIPLDWDEPWQRWPLPVLYGSITGFLSANIGAALLMQFEPGRFD